VRAESITSVLERGRVVAGFIVVYDDQASLCVPMTIDTECEGAIECGNGPVVVFCDRKAAQKAITIAVKRAELLKAQGKTANEDFLTGRKHVKIRPVTYMD